MTKPLWTYVLENSMGDELLHFMPREYKKAKKRADEYACEKGKTYFVKNSNNEVLHVATPPLAPNVEPVVRTKFIDYDARPNPKTRRFCCKCQKDLREGMVVRHVYVDDQMQAIHPDDIASRSSTESDYGWLLLGMDCAKSLGLEWSVGDRHETL